MASDPEGPELPKSYRACFSIVLVIFSFSSGGSSGMLNASSHNDEVLGAFPVEFWLTILCMCVCACACAYVYMCVHMCVCVCVCCGICLWCDAEWCEYACDVMQNGVNMPVV